jgi:hypothetical protein
MSGAFHHALVHGAKDVIRESMRENPVGTSLGLLAGGAVIMVAAPIAAPFAGVVASVASAVGVGGGTAAAVSATAISASALGSLVGCSVLGGSAEKVIKKR